MASDNMLLAESYVAMSNYPEAMPLLRKAVLLEPQNRRAIELAAAAAVQLGDKPTTIDMYKKFLELPKSPEHAEYAFKVAQLYEQVRDRASAQTWYQTNIKNYPQDIRNYERRAQLCIDDKEWDCAQKTLEAGGALPTATPEIKRMLAALYERLNMHEKAIDQYANYLTNTPNDSAALLSTGTLYYNQRQYQKTVDLLKKAHSLMPQNFESAFMLADSYMKLGRTQEAIDAFLEARRIKSKDDRVLSSLAQCYTTLQDTKNLIPILREWLFLDESNVDVKTRLGKALLAVHNTSEGARLLESVSRERPDDVEVHRLLYKTYQSTGDEELFVSHLKSALATSEYKADLYYELGKYYLRKDRRAQAMEYLQKAVDADGRMNAARYEYAQMLRQTGNTLEAWNQASKCIELDPYNASYLLLHSQVAYQMNKKDEATESVLKSLKIDSTNADALAWAGFLGNDAKTTDQSRPMLQRAIKVNPNCALCYEYLGDAYQLEANYPLAAQNYEKSLGLRAYSEATSVKLAKCVLLSGQPEKAGLLFEKILGMNAGNDEALYWLSHVYVTLGRLAEAEKLPQTYKFAKKTGWLHLAQGEVYEKQGNINAALISFSVASRLIPDEPLMLAATGRMNLVKKEYEDAVQNFGKALGQDPHNPRYLLELGKAYEGLTDFASALALYDEVIRTNPQYTDVFYFAARALSRSGDHAKAIEMLTKGLQRLDGDLRLTLALAHEYRAIGQYPKAIKFFEQVAESGKPEYVDGYRFVGMVYYDNLKEQSKAKKYFTKYVEAGGTDPKVKDLLATIP
jgi:tetratricopeptide (TPR) repeat protein